MTHLGAARTRAAADIFLSGPGEMARLTRTHDWSATPVGPVDAWTASLRTTVSTLLASRHAMFLWWGPELIQFYNDGYRPSLGPDRHPSALGARGRECWAEIWPIIGAEVESIMAGGEATWHEDHLVPITRGDRVRDVYWSYSYSPVRDDDGGVGGVLVTVQETTRRVVNERRVRLLQELAAEMLHAGSASEVFEAAMTTFRSAPDDVPFALLYRPKDAPEALRLRAGLIERITREQWPEPGDGEVTLAVGDGVLMLGLNPRLPLDEEASSFTAAVAHEITMALEAVERRERELAAARARDADERQLRTVLTQAPLAISIVGPSGEILFANPTFERLWGRPVEETRAEVYSEAYTGYHLDGRPIASHEWAGARAVLRGESVEGEVIQIVQASRRGEEGRRLTVWISAAPVRDAEGTITGGVVMMRDITVERRNEEQLRGAQRLQAVATLAGGVAHEVNNALQATLGFGAFVLRALGPEHPQAADMRLVLQSAERASRVSQQLLAYTRQQISQPEPVQLDALVTDLRPVLQQLLGADKLLALSPPAGPLPRIQADPAQVERVLINLIANARDATVTGDAVRIGLARVEASGAEETGTAEMGFKLATGTYVRLSVSDPGSGMAAETLTRMFDPFFTTKPVGEGTGLGLSMVYGTVKQHGGYIGARSAVGKGTTIEVYWPVAREDVSVGAAGNGADRESRPCGGRVVLVADDEPLVRALVVRTLEEEGCVVYGVADGTEALQLLDSQGVRPDLVVTDIIMPRLNGRQLYDAVRARWPDLPVLFISGRTGEEAVIQRLVPRGAPFLQKPFAPDALARTAADLLRRAQV